MSGIAQDYIVSRDKEVMGGTPVFEGTRVPVQALIDYIKGNHPLDEFLDDFPSVKREQAIELLNRIGEMLETAQV